jgi:tetratricopeptide (TPR) repeat protein
MRREQRGRVVLRKQPNVEVEREIVDLLRQVEEGVSVRDLVARLRKAPATIRENVSAADGKEIADFFKKIGADTVFTPYSKAELAAMSPVESPGKAPAQAEAKRPAAQTSPGRAVAPTVRSGRPVSGPRATGQAIIMKYLAILVLLGACLGAAMYLSQKNEGSSAPASAPAKPMSAPAPKPQSVAPDAMSQALLNQYILKPDTRFVSSFSVTARLYGALVVSGKGRPSLGEPLLSESELILPLLVDGKERARVTARLPLDFNECLKSLDAWLVALENALGPLPGPAATLEPSTLAKAAASISLVDPRAVLLGLSLLDQLRGAGSPHPESLRLAVQGYSLLLFVLNGDLMQYSDEFAAHGLAFLALGKKTGKAAQPVDLSREEALLSQVMGYSTHSRELMKTAPPATRTPLGDAFDAYARQDVDGLKAQAADGKQFLPAYLLARLLREVGRWDESKEAVRPLLERFPASYPALIELINSKDLAMAQMLTLFFPADIFGRLQAELTGGGAETWFAILNNVNEDALIKAEYAPARFEVLLDAWRPLPKERAAGLFMDEQRARLMYRALYVRALELRWEVLAERWGVPEHAEAFAAAMNSGGKGGPMGAYFLAASAAEWGRTAEAEASLEKLIREPGTPSNLAGLGVFRIQDHLKRLALLPVVANRLDSRPQFERYLGAMIYNLWNYDLALTHYQRSFSLDVDCVSLYEVISKIKGSDAPLIAGLERFPNNLILLRTACKYYNRRGDTASLEKSLGLYDRILALEKDDPTTTRHKASVLRRLKRYDTGIALLKDRLTRPLPPGLDKTMLTTLLAKTLLEKGDLPGAQRAISEVEDKAQADAMVTGARIQEASGDKTKAKALFMAAVERYPTSAFTLSEAAGFFWRQGEDSMAAALITKGRPSQGQYSQWYFEHFFNIFGAVEAVREQRALTALINLSMPPYEANSLGFRRLRAGRPDMAMWLFSSVKPNGFMQQLEREANVYVAHKAQKGADEAWTQFMRNVPEKARGPLTMVLLSNGLYEELLRISENLDAFSSEERECVRLERLLAWISLERKPASLVDSLEKAYAKPSSDIYHTAGRYILGKINLKDALDAVKTPKQRCEMAYYIGLAQRLQGKYYDAALWYQVCLETLLQNNGEYHWATNELFWWTKVGLDNRSRLPSKDKENALALAENEE